MARTGRDDAAASEGSNSKDQAVEALELMQRALSLIDSTDGPPDAGAHLDIAIHRLRDWIEDQS